LTKYTAKLDVYDVRYPSHLNGLAQENVVYILESEGSTIQVAFAFVNKTLHHCGMFVIEGSPLYTQLQPADPVNLANMVLQNFQTYSQSSAVGDSRNFAEMKNILGTVENIEDVETTLGSTKLKVTSNSDIAYTAFELMHILNGVAFPGITLEFLNGTFSGLGDNWRIYQIGSTDLKISEEEATKIALNYLEGFSWNATQDGEWVDVTDFELVEETLTTELITTRNKEPLTLYPSWDILVYLDKLYPGNVNRVAIAIWADTGEIISCTPLSMGGVIPSESQISTPKPIIDDTIASNGVLLIAALAMTLSATVFTAMVVKKKHK
jgi:hypothetical protein